MLCVLATDGNLHPTAAVVEGCEAKTLTVTLSLRGSRQNEQGTTESKVPEAERWHG